MNAPTNENVSRSQFEEAAFLAYFMSNISRDLKIEGPMEDMETFCRRDPENPEHYQREDVSAMWFGWQMREKQA